MEKTKLNILLLAGGESSERFVSLDSSREVAKALTTAGHEVTIMDAATGGLITGADIEAELAAAKKKIGAKIDAAAFDGVLPTKKLIAMRDRGIDVVFLGLHGGMGENGGIQAMLDMIGLPYTGSPMAASAIAMNKDISKRVMQSLGIPTADWKIYHAGRNARTIIHALVADLTTDTYDGPALPFIVKPVDSGSTVGLSLVEVTEEVAGALQDAFDESDLIMIENYVEGREITVGILDGRALPPVEIVPSNKLYDYTCKYTKGKSQYFCPADIDDGIRKTLSENAVTLYNSIGCRGYARVDFIVAPDGSYVCLELNTLPGMTELSLLPMAARASGIEFAQLVEKLCYLAIGEDA